MLGASRGVVVESSTGALREGGMPFMLMAIFGAILPRFVLLVGWSNDPAGWQAAVGGPVLLLGGFLFFPWTTLIYGFVAPNGLSLLNIIFLIAAFLIDLGTWGVGFFASREQVSSYRGT
jgi:hypothetical protein